MSWKLTLPCTRAESEALAGDVPEMAAMDAPPVLVTTEPDPARPDEWRLDAYFEERPSAELVRKIVALVPSAAGTVPVVEQLPDEDWLRLSQAGLEPIATGRFFVHTPAHRGGAPKGFVALEIDAGRAFGTGHHETTTGCLLALERLHRQGLWFRDILDIGTGTGLLAFAALKLWPTARVAASDIDPVSIEVTAENAAMNDIPLGRHGGQVELVVAPGLESGRLIARAPYDLIIANILAGPLVELAPTIAAALAPHGQLLLAGLLDSQAEAVGSAYRRHGVALQFKVERGEWPTLALRKRARWS